MVEKALSIQEVATRTGISIDTLRYYERIGLMDAISRAPNGHRRYTEADLAWIHLLKCLRTTSMPIVEMQKFAELARQGDTTIPERCQLLEAHRETLLLQLQNIYQTLQAVEDKIRYYREQESTLLSANEQHPML